MKAKLPEYTALVKELRDGCGNRSELSGDMADWRSDGHVEPHHIDGRNGKRLTDPFNIILVNRSEHLVIEESNGWEAKQKLKEYIRPIRIKQGYKELK